MSTHFTPKWKDQRGNVMIFPARNTLFDEHRGAQDWSRRVPCTSSKSTAGSKSAAYYAVTSAEKARARRLHARGLVRLTEELDTSIKLVRGHPRLIAREIFYVEPVPVSP